jgi:hypothetical protein
MPGDSEFMRLLHEREAEAERMIESAKARGDAGNEREARKLLAGWRNLITKTEGSSSVKRRPDE